MLVPMGMIDKKSNYLYTNSSLAEEGFLPNT